MFEYEGGQYTYEDLQNESIKQGIEFSEFMRGMKERGMTQAKDTSESKGLNLDISTQQPVTRKDKEGLETEFYDYKKNSNAYNTGITNFFKYLADDYQSKEVVETDRKKGEYFAMKQHMAPFLGVDNPLANFFAEHTANMFRSGSSGITQGEGTQIGFDIMGAGKHITLEEAQGLVDVNARNQAKEQTDAVKLYQDRYDLIEEEHGGIMAFMVGVAENPEYIRDVSISSMAMMASALLTSEDVAARATISAGTAGAAGSFIPGFGTGLGFMSGLMGGVSGSMDASLSYQQFLQEQLTEDGKDFTAENIQALLQDDRIETYEDPNGNSFMNITGTKAQIIKQRAIQRGIAIGVIDGTTAILAGGTARGSFSSGSTKLATKTTRAIKGTAGAVTGGLASEIGGQTFGRQEYDAGEIMTEGFAEKGMVMTGVTVIPQLLKKKGKYTIKGEVMSEARFVKEVNNMTDFTLARADITVENDVTLNTQLGLRQQDAIIESQISTRVSGVEDRKTLVAKQKQLNKAEADANKKGSTAVPGADAKVLAIKAEIEGIINKYSSVDGRKKEVRDRAKIKELVRDARSKILLKDTEKFADSSGKKLDLNPYQAFTNSSKFVQGVVDHLIKQGKYVFNGKEVDISKLSDKKIAEEVQRITRATKDGVGAAILTDTNGKDTIFINREAAVKYGQLNVGSHEILHKVLKGAITNMKPDARRKMISEFKQEIETNLGSGVLADIETRLKSYGKMIDIETTDEWFTALSDVIEDKNSGITYDNNKSFFDNIKDKVANLFNKQTDYKNLSIKTGQDAFEFMKEYSKSVKKGELSERMVAFSKGQKIPPEEREAGAKFSMTQDSKDSVDGMADMGWTNESWKEQGADFAIKSMKDEKLLDGLIRSKYKAEIVPKNFVDLVYSELVSHVKNFKPEDNNSLFGWVNSQISNKAGNVYNREFKVEDEMKGAKDVDSRSKEGEVKVQVAAKKSTEMEAFEEEDLSIQGQAKKEIADKQRYSEYRQKLGFETGSKIYNEVLENVKKSLMIAYGTTQNIKDVQLRAQAIALKLKKEYANLNSPLFKQIKNFLTYGIADAKVPYGTKDTYISNLKKFREDIVKNVSTSDLVQMERNTPEADRIFTSFVKTLTSIEQVQDAVNKEQLPPEALNKITKDKKTGKGAFSPSLYEKIMPAETELISWADQPGINPITGSRQGLKGTRKDGIAMRMVNSLVTDAIMEARQSEQVQERIAGMDIDPGSVAELGAAIGREVNVKFSKSNAIGDISAAMNNTGSVNVYSQIKFSKKHRDAYEKQLTKRRPDLTEKQRKNAVQSVFDFVDSEAIPNHLKSKYEKMAMHYTANGFLILPEDGYKVIEAERVATKKKLDPFSFKNPNVLIETFVGEVKGTRTNPDNVKTFTNKTELAGGVTVYNVEDSKQGQADTRKVIDTHFGKESNPWCLAARTKSGTEGGDAITTVEYNGLENVIKNQYLDESYEYGDAEILVKSTNKQKVEKLVVKLLAEYSVNGTNKYKYKVSTEQAAITSHGDGKKGDVQISITKIDQPVNLESAWFQWKHYNKEGNGHQIAFQNGRLVAFRDGKNDPQWWDRNDKPTSGVVIRGKKVDGFKEVIEVDKTKENLLYYEKVTGNKKNGTTIEKDIDGSLISQVTKKNGKMDGKNIRVDKPKFNSNEYHRKTTENYKDGSRLDFKEERTYTDKNARVSTKVGRSEEIRLNNITKYERSFTEKDGVLNSEIITIEGTIDQPYFKEFNDPTSPSMTGFEKTNLPYLTPAYERYYSAQGQEVTVKQEFTDKAKYSGQGPTITIDGVVQEQRVKFSKSNVKFAKSTALDVMLSQKQDKKLLPFIQRTIKTFEDKKQLSIEEETILNVLQPAELLVEQGHRLEEVFAVLMDNYNAELVKDIVRFGTVKKIRNLINDYHMPRIRIEGSLAMGKIYKNDFTKATSKKNKMELVDEYAKMIGISERNGQGLSNQVFMEQTLYLVFDKDFINENYDLEENSYGGKSLAYKNGEFVPMFHSIKDIKNNSRSRPDLVKTVNLEAAEAIKYVQRIINTPESILSMADKIAIIDLLSLDQRGVIRKMYKLGVGLNNSTKAQKYKVGKTEDADGGNITLEHRITAADMTLYIQERIKGRLSETKLSEIIEQATVHVLPRKYKGIDLNKTLDAAGYKITGGKNRYSVLEKYFDLLYNKGDGLIDSQPVDITPVDMSKLESIIRFSRSTQNPTKGITVLDFDDTLATSKSLIRFTRPDGTKGKLNAEQYASTYESLSELGYKWDFSEFTKVVDGKVAPLFQKALKLQEKFGNGNMFILTARPSESAPAIHAFLKANGLNIPLKNITGLANSTAEAKALWVAEKVGEGYNDFYFADDALQNVKAVKNMLDQFDVKSKVQQARVNFSKSMDPAFNMMLERTTGIDASEMVSKARATKRGNKKGRYAMFVPPSAEDFLGLLYYFAGRGKQGDADLAFLKKSLIDPLNRAYTELDETKQSIADDYRNLKKQDPDSAGKLRKESPDEDFTYGDAVRVYLWNKSGIEVPGLSQKDQDNLIELVTSDPKLQAFADKLGLISRQEEGYTKPGDYWQVGDIRNDLDDATSKIGRKQFFTEFIENTDVVFSEENLNKIQSIYGSNFREALEDMLYRIKTGSTRNIGGGRIEGGFNHWMNGSVAATMFINTRSALLQTLSSVNFLNWGDNNPAKAAKAFANQKQYWTDFSMIFNSAKLKQRRSGLGMDINANELVTYMSKSKSSPKALLSWLLQKGFLPTQMADSFAIASGGATFYRNRFNTYVKQGMNISNAKTKAWNDFSEIAEATQQSARPDMVSQQQASPLGKYLLNFQNTPMQYTRLIKKAAIDLMKGRGDVKTNISRIVYYGAVQNMIFYGLQTALFAMMFGNDEEEELTVDKNGIKPGKDGYIKTTKREVFIDSKKARAANGMVDSLLRGTGIGGAFVATIKNVIIETIKQRKKPAILRDGAETLIQALNLSPVIGIKGRKINTYNKTYNWNEDVIKHMSTFDIDNPILGGTASLIEGATNIPLNRLHRKVSNVRATLNADNEAWQRLSTLLGFSTWDVGIENTEIDAIKAELKELKAEESKRKRKEKNKNKKLSKPFKSKMLKMQ